MTCDDFICLGRTVPEESKKYGHKVCMAGFSAEMRALLRVYPLPVVNPVRAGQIHRMELDRNPCDSRMESWRLRDRSHIPETSGRWAVADIVSHLRRYHMAGSIRELNDARRSLGVIEAHNVLPEFDRRSTARDPEQLELFETCDATFGANAIHLMPYLQFDDADGPHRLQVREWGCYEWIRKNPATASQVWDNLQIAKGGSSLIVIGNMANARNSWLIIKTYPVEAARQALLFNDVA
jgi:hypothetical protein